MWLQSRQTLHFMVAVVHDGRLYQRHKQPELSAGQTLRVRLFIYFLVHVGRYWTLPRIFCRKYCKIYSVNPNYSLDQTPLLLSYFWKQLSVLFLSVRLCAFSSQCCSDTFIIWLSELQAHSTFFLKDNIADFKSLLLRHKESACLLPCLFWAKDKNILLESHLALAAGWSRLYSIPITRVLWPPP